MSLRDRIGIEFGTIIQQTCIPQQIASGKHLSQDKTPTLVRRRSARPRTRIIEVRKTVGTIRRPVNDKIRSVGRPGSDVPSVESCRSPTGTATERFRAIRKPASLTRTTTGSPHTSVCRRYTDSPDLHREIGTGSVNPSSARRGKPPAALPRCPPAAYASYPSSVFRAACVCG